MKDKLFKYSLVVVLSSMAYFAIATYDQKDACASGECIDFVSVAMEFIGAIEAIMNEDPSAIAEMSFIGQYIKSIKDKINMYKDFYNNMLKKEAEETKEMMQKIARQHRNATIATTGQRVNIKEAAATIKKTVKYQRSQVDTLARRFPAPSNQVCRQTNQAIRDNQTDNAVAFEQAVQRETRRRRNSGISAPTGGRGIQSLTSLGPGVYRAMMIDATRNNCFGDEHLGNTSLSGGSNVMCYLPNNGWSWIHDKASALTLTGSLTTTMPTEMYTELYQMAYIKELLLPPLLTAHPPKSIRTDSVVQNSYLDLTTEQTRRSMNEEIVDYLSTRRSQKIGENNQLATSHYSGVDPLPANSQGYITFCQRSREMVRQTYNETYGHPLIGSSYGEEECPAAETIDHASMLSVSSSAGLGAIFAQEEANRKQSELYIYILRHKLDFNVRQKEDMITLQHLLNNIGSTAHVGATSIDSIGRGE